MTEMPLGRGVFKTQRQEIRPSGGRKPKPRSIWSPPKPEWHPKPLEQCLVYTYTPWLELAFWVPKRDLSLVVVALGLWSQITNIVL